MVVLGQGVLFAWLPLWPQEIQRRRGAVQKGQRGKREVAALSWRRGQPTAIDSRQPYAGSQDARQQKKIKNTRKKAGIGSFSFAADEEDPKRLRPVRSPFEATVVGHEVYSAGPCAHMATKRREFGEGDKKIKFFDIRGYFFV
ncbi:hypothetical protein [Pandoravirus japonicus]|uniref:Uncharacterized protein n=1 Tax=Pandoravirus japonicus TaxID=2823154 RepID=A0A811BRA3_9VIRU|nr:hypothetical protein [Pandoravirus japonicus]